ncbi:MAG TPA: hypothetical protein PJ994_13415, partial [Tepidiformaceae bacterium]|nr:hypothetical protein [Tepidiformaceae bacterium]
GRREVAAVGELLDHETSALGRLVTMQYPVSRGGELCGKGWRPARAPRVSRRRSPGRRMVPLDAHPPAGG